MTRLQRRILWGSLLLASFAVSLVLWLAFPSRLQPVVLFFPAANGSGVQGELRHLPFDKNPSHDLRVLVESLLAGPLSHEYKALVPESTRILGLFVRDKVVWINLDNTFQLAGVNCPLSPRERAEWLKHTLVYNDAFGMEFRILIDSKELSSW